jgi:hypothetical protein
VTARKLTLIHASGLDPISSPHATLLHHKDYGTCLCWHCQEQFPKHSPCAPSSTEAS